MKLSSISFIAVTLAATVNSAIATPVPIYARALERVGSFKRDVYRREVEAQVNREPVDNLFTRQVKDSRSWIHLGASKLAPKFSTEQQDTARALRRSATICDRASQLATKAANNLPEGRERVKWQKKAHNLGELASELRCISEGALKKTFTRSLERDKHLAADYKAQAIEVKKAARSIIDATQPL